MPEVIHVFSEQDSKSSLLAEVHRLQSSLAAMRQARDFHGANSAELMQERDRLQEEIEMLKQIEQEPAPVEAGLMERMRTSYHNNSEYCDEMALSRVGMTAALRVAADALLPEESMELRMEWEAAWKQDEAEHNHFPSDKGFRTMFRMLAGRRARLLAPEKSVEERVIDILKRTHGDFGYKAIAAEIVTTLKQEGK